MLRVSMSFMGLTAIAFPLFGAIFAVVWSILYDYEASVRTACRVSVFFLSQITCGGVISRIELVVGNVKLMRIFSSNIDFFI